MYDTKKFNLGDNCAIVIGGKINGRLADLKPNDKLIFSYDEINGVNVANRLRWWKTAGNENAAGAANDAVIALPGNRRFKRVPSRGALIFSEIGRQLAAGLAASVSGHDKKSVPSGRLC